MNKALYRLLSLGTSVAGGALAGDPGRRRTAEGTAKLTGTWPGEGAPEQEQE